MASVKEERVRPLPRQPSGGIGDAARLAFLARVASTLDLHALIDALLEALQPIVAVDGVRFEHGATTVSSGRKPRHEVRYRLLPQEDLELGEIVVLRATPFKEPELAAVEELLPYFAVALRNALEYRRAQELALKDPLTGVGNRLALLNAAAREIEIAQRHGRAFSLLMVDLDRFKSINDTHGHAAGDVVLQLVAATLQQAVRRSDAVYRYGGEEFVVMLPHTDHAGARIMAERVRVLVASNRQIEAHLRAGVTASIGVATLRADDTLATLCDRADQALYAAKSAGRNRIVSES
jgi:diguanylate cyclase (GGDEF)-like protein